MGSIIQMRGVSTGGTESGLAAIDIPKNGDIVGVEWAIETALDTTADSQSWQVSFGSVMALVNDSRQVIANASLGRLTFATAVGATIGRVDRFAIIPDLPVSMGERLFLHANGSAGVVGTCLVCIHFNFDLDMPLARRR